MTEINSQKNISSVQGEKPLVETKAPETTTVAKTSGTTAHGKSVNIGAQKAWLSYEKEKPTEATKEALYNADNNPNQEGIKNFLKAIGFSNKDIAKIAAKAKIALAPANHALAA